MQRLGILHAKKEAYKCLKKSENYKDHIAYKSSVSVIKDWLKAPGYDVSKILSIIYDHEDNWELMKFGLFDTLPSNPMFIYLPCSEGSPAEIWNLLKVGYDKDLNLTDCCGKKILKSINFGGYSDVGFEDQVSFNVCLGCLNLRGAGDDKKIYEKLSAMCDVVKGIVLFRSEDSHESAPSCYRQAKWAKEGWTYHVLNVTNKRKTKRELGGTHASPRWHERRGHWRTLKSGKSIWIGQCEIGNKERGGVIKDYRFGHSPATQSEATQ